MKKSTQLLAFCLAVLLFTNSLLAYAPEANLWAERRSQQKKEDPIVLASLPSQISLPPIANRNILPRFESNLPKNLTTLPTQYGSIRQISTPTHSNGKTVIHILDIHMNAEAQKNIEQTVTQLMADKKIGLVALEGAFGDIDLSVYKKNLHASSIRKLADYMLRVNEITGPIHAAFVNNQPTLFAGVDDRIVYESNVGAYRTSAKLKDRVSRDISSHAEKILQQKKNLFNRDLLAFDTQVEQFRHEKLALGDYVEMLSHYQPTSTAVDVFLEAHRLEKNLNLNAIEKERAQVLSELLKRLSQEQTSELMSLSVAYRAGQISNSNFYSYLRGLCTLAHVNLRAYPAMESYLQYVLLSDSIAAEKFLTDLKKMEKATYAALSKTENEKQLVQQSNYLHLASKLVEFSLTPEEWAEYKSFLPMSHNGEIGRGLLLPFEQFYIQAEKRDQLMARNLLSAMERKNIQTAVLVTGGFHSTGIDRLLQNAGVMSIAFAPKITKIEDENGTSYLSVFSQQKTPLDQLFKGQKLFLSNIVLPGQKTLGTKASIIEEKDFPGTLDSSMQKLVTGDNKASVIERTSNKLRVKIKDVVVNLKTNSRNEIDGFDSTSLVPGSSTGHLFIDPIWEVVVFAIPLLAFGVYFFMGYSGNATVIGGIGYVVLSIIFKPYYVIMHGSGALYHAQQLNPTLTETEYRQKLSDLYNSLTVFTLISFLGFLGTFSLSTANVNDTVLLYAALKTVAINIIVHEVNNILAWLGVKELVPGSSWLGDIPKEIPSIQNKSNMEALRFYQEMTEARQGNYEEQIKFRASRLRDEISQAVQPLAGPIQSVDYDLRSHLRPDVSVERSFEDFWKYTTDILDRSSKDNRWMISISGTVGGGKTTVVKKLEKALRERYSNRQIRIVKESDFSSGLTIVGSFINWFKERIHALKSSDTGLSYSLKVDGFENPLSIDFENDTVRIKNGDHVLKIVQQEGQFAGYAFYGGDALLSDPTSEIPPNALGDIPVAVTADESGDAGWVTIVFNGETKIKINIQGQILDFSDNNSRTLNLVKQIWPDVNANRQEIVIVDGNIGLKSDDFHVSANVNSGFIFRRRRTQRETLVNKQLEKEAKEKTLEDFNKLQYQDLLVDAENRAVRDRRGFGTPGANHFDINGLQLAEQLYRAYDYNMLLLPGIVDYFRNQHGIDLKEMASTLNALGEEVLIDWIEETRKDHEKRSSSFRHPENFGSEAKMSNKEAHARYWAAWSQGSAFVTLALGQHLLMKFYATEGSDLGTLPEKSKFNLQRILERVNGIFTRGQIVNLRGRLFGKIKYEELRSTSPNDEPEILKKEVRVEDALIINQVPFVADRLTSLAQQINPHDSLALSPAFIKGTMLMEKFFQVQREMWVRGIVDRAPDIMKRYGIDLRHGEESVVCLAPGSLVLDKQAAETLGYIALNHDALPQNREDNLPDYVRATDFKPRHQNIEGFQYLKGYQLQFADNIYTGEDFLSQVPEVFQETYVHLIHQYVPEDIYQLRRQEFGEKWDRAVKDKTSAQYKNAGVSSAVIEDVQISHVEHVIAEYFLNRLEGQFKEYFSRVSTRPGTPALVWMSLFQHALPHDPNSPLFVLTNDLIYQLTNNPSMLANLSLSPAKREETVMTLFRQLSDGAWMDANRKPWETEFYQEFLKRLVSLPGTWEEFDAENKKVGDNVVRQEKTAEIRSPYHEALVEKYADGQLPVPARDNSETVGRMVGKMKTSEADINTDPDTESYSGNAVILEHQQIALEKFREEAKKGAKGEKVLAVTLAAGESSRMDKGSIAKLVLQALFDETLKFIDQEKLTEEDKKNIDELSSTVSPRSAALVQYVRNLVLKAQGEDKKTAAEAAEKLKGLLYSPKALAPCAKVDGKWYNFLDFNMLNVKKANDEVENAGSGRPFIAGLMLNMKYENVIRTYLQSVNYYGFKEGVDLVIFYQPLGYAGAATEKDVQDMIRDAEIKFHQGKAAEKDLEFKTEDSKSFARAFAKKNFKKVLYELGKKAEGHGWVYLALLLKEGNVKEPPIVTLNKLNVREFWIHNIDTAVKLDDVWMAGYGMKLKNKKVATFQVSAPTDAEKGKGGGAIKIDLHGKQYFIQAEWDEIQESAKKVGLTLDQLIKDAPDSPFNNATSQTDIFEAFKLILGDKFDQALNTKDENERDKQLNDLVLPLAEKMRLVPLARFEKIPDPTDITGKAKRLVGRVLFELRAWQIQNADLTRTGFIYTASAESYMKKMIRMADYIAKNGNSEKLFELIMSGKARLKGEIDFNAMTPQQKEAAYFAANVVFQRLTPDQQVEFFRRGEFGSLKTMDIYDLAPMQNYKTAVTRLVVQDKYKLFTFDMSAPAEKSIAASSSGHPFRDVFVEHPLYFTLAPALAFIYSALFLMTTHVSERFGYYYLGIGGILLIGLGHLIVAQVLEDRFVLRHGEEAYQAVLNVLKINREFLSRQAYQLQIRKEFRQMFKISFRTLLWSFLPFNFVLGRILGPVDGMWYALYFSIIFNQVIVFSNHFARNHDFFFGSRLKRVNKRVGDELINAAYYFVQTRRQKSLNVEKILGEVFLDRVDSILSRKVVTPQDLENVDLNELAAYIDQKIISSVHRGDISPETAEHAVLVLSKWLGVKVEGPSVADKRWVVLLRNNEMEVNRLVQAINDRFPENVDLVVDDNATELAESLSAQFKPKKVHIRVRHQPGLFKADQRSVDLDMLAQTVDRYHSYEVQDAIFSADPEVTFANSLDTKMVGSNMQYVDYVSLDKLVGFGDVHLMPLMGLIEMIKALSRYA